MSEQSGWYLLESGPDGAMSVIASWENLRAALHDVCCCCGAPDKCDNEFVADWDDYCEEQQREGAEWDLEDGFIRIQPLAAKPEWRLS